VQGQADFTHNITNRGGSVAANTLHSPYDVGLDASGRLWVADTLNNRVLRFDAAASKADGANADGVLGGAGSVAANTLNTPIGVTLDASGQLWVADRMNHRVLRFEAAASKADGAAADGVLGQADFTSGIFNRGGSVAANTMNYPTGVAMGASGWLWVADLNNNRVLAFDFPSLAVFKSSQDVNGGLLYPGEELQYTITLTNTLGAAQTGVVISDTIPAHTTYASGSARSSKGSRSGPDPLVFSIGGLAVNEVVTATFRVKVDLDADDRVLSNTAIADSAEASPAPSLAVQNHVERRVALALGQADFVSGDSNRGGSVEANTLSFPTGVAVDPTTGKVFVADNGNNRVLRYATFLALVSGAAAEGVLGQADFTQNYSNRGGSVAANTLSFPKSVALDASGRLWVADQSNHRLLRFDNAASKADGAAADGVLGQADFTHNSSNRGGSAAANTLNSPHGVALDASGRLWAADQFNHRLLRFDNAAGKADGAAADGVLGQADFTSGSANRGGSAAANTLYYPIGVALDASGRLWTADRGNHRALRFEAADSKADGAAADGVLGQADFTSGSANRGGSVAANTLNTPIGVVLDASGRLWAADRNNHRLLRFDNAASQADGAAADGVLGQADFTSGSANRGGSVAANTLNYPTGIALDASGRLWVADLNNNRVLGYGKFIWFLTSIYRNYSSP